MATIPNQGTGLRHARKTINFDGGANNGNLGDDVTLFTTTGVVLPVYCIPRITDSLVCSAPAATALSIPGRLMSEISLSGAVTGAFPDADASEWYTGNAIDTGFGHSINRVASEDILMSVVDLTGGADITDGTIVVDIWYLPVTDDGALAGDDIDTELGAYLADKLLDEALSGHTTAGSLGKAVADIETDVDAILVDTGTTLQAELDGIQADTEDIQSRLPAALVGGRIDATVDGTGMEAGAIDAILTRQMTEAYAADGAAPTVAQALFLIMQMLTEKSITSTTLTVKKLDGSTTAATFTLDSATEPTSITRAT